MKILARVLPERSFRPWLWGTLVLMLVCALAAGWSWYALSNRSRAGTDSTLQDLQVFGDVPDFSLTDRTGRTVTRANLLGTVWVANFIYTRCTDTCPLQSARMAALQKDFAGERDVRFLSITVDPKRDTPAVLAKYAARYGADSDRWWFLTGDKPTIYALIQEGFRLSVEDPTELAAPASSPRPRSDRLVRPSPRLASGSADRLEQLLRGWLFPSAALAHSDADFLAPPFLHSSWFVLGDRAARIRGYYRTEEEQPMKRLRQDIRTLLVER